MSRVTVNAERFANLFGCHPAHANDFVSGRFALNYLDGVRCNTEQFSQKLPALFVSFVIDRRRTDSKFDRSIVFPREFCARGARLDADIETDTSVFLFDSDHSLFSEHQTRALASM